jgi:type I restriction enzyme M protein
MTKTADTAATLRAIRARLDLTQEQLAERLGVSFATVNRWEGGANVPQKAAREAIENLAREAGVDKLDGDDLLGTPATEVARRRRSKSTAAAPSTKPMEQMLWDAACSIRGEKDAAKFKDYLLPLLFLKRLSDVFDDEIERLAEEYGDRETALEIAEGDHSLLRFYLAAEARWGVIAGRESFDWPLDAKGNSTAPRDIGEHLTKAVRAVVKQNPSLSGVIDVVDFAAERNGERDINPAKLRGVVETFSDPRYRLGLADVQPDFLGRAYEYLLRKFAEGSGQSAGEFFTPTEVGFLMAHIMRPKPGEDCHDYACGSAGLLVKLQLVARELDPTSKVPLKLTAQELQAESYAVAKMNAIIHDMQIELARGDTMINPKFRTPEGKIRTHDVVVANPMWNQPFAPDVFANDPFDRFRTTGGITTGRGDWAWLQHTLACLNEKGRAAVVLDTGAVTRGSGSKNEDRERNIRKWFVDRDLIDGVILLPDNLFYNTTAAGVIIVLSKRKPSARKSKIVLVDASGRVRKGRPKNYIPEEVVRPLAAAFLKGEEVPGETAVISTQQAQDADYSLSPSRWVEKTDRKDAGDLATLLGELRELDREAHSLSTTLVTLLSPVIGVQQAADDRSQGA